jgi:hypothetical protein
MSAARAAGETNPAMRTGNTRVRIGSFMVGEDDAPGQRDDNETKAPGMTDGIGGRYPIDPRERSRTTG